MNKKIVAYKRCSGTYEVPAYSDPILDKDGKVLTFENIRHANIWIVHRLGIRIFYLVESPWHSDNPPKAWPGMSYINQFGL